MPSYTFAFIEYDDLTALSGNPLTTTSTTGTTGSFSVNGGASPISITVNDDDSTFHDAYIDTGTSQTLASDVVVNGTTYLAGSVVELEFKVSTTTGETFAYIRIDGVNVGIGGAYGSMPQVGQTYTIASSTDGELEAYDDMACFAKGTQIETPDGSKAIESLKPGEWVETLENGPQQLLWIGQRTLYPADLESRPEWTPVRIRAGALGNAEDLVVSQQHRLLISDWRAQYYFGEQHVLVPAKGMINGCSVVKEPRDRSVTYFHLLLSSHQILIAGGIPSESYHPGDHKTKGFNELAQAEVLNLFPHVAALWDAQGYGPTAHPVLRVKLARAVDWARAA